MICVSVGRTRHTHMIAEYHHLAKQGVKLVELRLDYIGRSVNLTRLLRDRPCQVVITCRRREDGGRWQKTEEERLMLLRNAIATGVDFVDLEEDIAGSIPRYGQTKRIISFHDFNHTPDNLPELHARLAAQEADIVKIATVANTIDDVLRMIDLAKHATIPTIAICMGELGTATRILAGRFGAPFTFATYSTDRKLAPGQLNWKVMVDQYRFDSITPDTPLFGVIADPVGHSHSPLIHNAAFFSQDIDARYLPFQLPREDLTEFIEAAPGLGIRGLSVTIPHKEAALDLMTVAEAAATGIGAINTIIFDGDQRLGYNTDYRAAMECLAPHMGASEHPEQPWRGKKALILGAGGVARAIGWGLIQKGAHVTYTSRNLERAQMLASQIGGSTIAWADRHQPDVDLLVNATPVGMHPDLDSTPFRADAINPNTVIFETIYNPERTLLIKDARDVGCKTITGVEMFVRQAAYQYRLFADRDAPVQLMQQTLKTATNPIRLNNPNKDDDHHNNDAAGGGPMSETISDSATHIWYRLANMDDVPALLEMLEPFVVGRKLLRRTAEEIAGLTRHGFVAETEDCLVGFSAIEVYSRKLAEIQSLAVAEGYQGRGIGRKLVTQCLERARELDVMEVLAISASDDFLRSCGFDYSLPDQKRALFCQLRGRGH